MLRVVIVLFKRSFAVRAIDEFRARLLDNVIGLEREIGNAPFAVPVGLFLVLDQQNGGDDTAEELIRRFSFLDLESRQIIDFFFLGWSLAEDRRLAFDLTAFQECRDTLRDAGVQGFGGYADLLVFDAWYRDGNVELDFENAIHIDLAEALSSKRITNVGGLLQSLIEAAGAARDRAGQAGVVTHISDRLGLAVARSSFLDFIAETWGKMIGAPKLLALTTKRVGPRVNLAAL